MKYLALVLSLLLLPVAADAGGKTKVRGYTRKDGTYVAPHERSSSNSTKSDNYGTPGNYNPNKGTVTPGDPYAPSYQDDYRPKRKSGYGSYYND